MSQFFDSQPYNWRTQKVFISSTFRDFHAERDYMIKYVFPELRQWCLQWKIHLVDIDLRWGVTDEEVEAGKVLELCFKGVDSARPLFICMLGGRYGEVLDEEQWQSIAPQTLTDYSQLKTTHEWKNCSLTHLEIIHAAIKPFSEEEERTPHSFFYLRDGVNLPKELPFYSEINKAKLDRLKKEIKSTFNGVPNQEVSGKLYQRVFEYTPDFDKRAPNPEDDKLKGRIVQTSLQPFGDRIKKNLKESIELLFAERIAFFKEHRNEEPLLVELDLHETYVENRTEVFIGRENHIEELKTYIENNVRQIKAVYGVAGSGKSSLMAKLYKEITADNKEGNTQQNQIVIPHFVGASPLSTSLPNMLSRFCNILKEANNINQAIPVDINLLQKTFASILFRVRKKTVILIDGLNQLDNLNDAHSLTWLPSNLPRNVKIIISTLDGIAKENLNKITTIPPVEVNPLTDKEKEDIIREIPSLFAKTIKPEYIRLIVQKEGSNNPLWLNVALEELRLFGGHELLKNEITHLPIELEEIFIYLIKRLEYENRDRPGVVEEMLCLLECSRFGLSEQELEDLLDDSKEKRYQLILRQIRIYFQLREELVDFHHRAFSKAIRSHYDLEVNAHKWHKKIGEYFNKQESFLSRNTINEKSNKRKVVEQARQFILEGNSWEEVINTLCNLWFLDAKVASDFILDLQNDYIIALANHPENKNTILRENERVRRLEKYAKDLEMYLKSETNKIESQEVEKRSNWLSRDFFENRREKKPSIQPVKIPFKDQKEVKTEVIKPQLSQLNRINIFEQFFKSNLHNLEKGKKFSSHTIQTAYNYSASNPIVEQAEYILQNYAFSNHLILERSSSKSTPQSSLLKVLEGHISEVKSIKLSTDGKTAVSASKGRVRVWNLEKGICIHDINVHSILLSVGNLTINGKMTVARHQSHLSILDLEKGNKHTESGKSPAGKDIGIIKGNTLGIWICQNDELKIWDYEREKNYILPGIDFQISEVYVYDDGNNILYKSTRPINFYIYNIETGENKKVLFKNGIKLFNVSMDGKFGYGVDSNDKTLSFWDIRKNKCVGTLGVNTNLPPLNRIRMSPNGKFAFTTNPYPRVWDLKKGICIHEFKTHVQTWWANSVKISGDGNIAISTYRDGTLRVWDMKKGICLDELHGRRGIGLNDVSMNAGGSLAITASEDGLSIWDLKNGDCIRRYPCPSKYHAATFVSLSSNGRYAASAYEDNSIYVWDLESNNKTRLTSIQRNQIGMVKGICLNSKANLLVSASADNTLQVWNVKNRACTHVLEGHTAVVNGVCISSDGKLAVSASGDKTLRVWELESGICKFVLKGHKLGVNGVSISVDSKIAVSASWDMTLRVWDLESGECKFVLAGHNQGINSVVLSGDGKRAVSSSYDRTIRFWDLEARKCLFHLNSYNEASYSYALSIDPGFNYAVMADYNKNLILMDLLGGKHRKIFSGHGDQINDICLGADGKIALSASKDKTIRVFDLEKGVPIDSNDDETRLFGIKRLKINANNKLAISDVGNGIIRVWDIESGKCKYVLDHKDASQIEFSFDGKLALSSGGKSFRIWDMESGSCVYSQKVYGPTFKNSISNLVVLKDGNAFHLLDLNSKKVFFTLRHNQKKVGYFVASTDGKKIVSASSTEPLTYWNLDKEKENCMKKLEPPSGFVREIRARRDFKKILTFDWSKIQIWNWFSDSFKISKTIPVGMSSYCIDACPDLSLAITSRERILSMWDLNEGKCLHTLKGHVDKISKVKISTDGKMAVSAGEDKTIRLWDLENGQCLQIYSTESNITALEFKNKVLITFGTSTGKVGFLDIVNSKKT